MLLVGGKTTDRKVAIFVSARGGCPSLTMPWPSRDEALSCLFAGLYEVFLVARWRQYGKTSVLVGMATFEQVGKNK